MFNCDRTRQKYCGGYDPFQSGKMRMLMMVLMTVFVVVLVVMFVVMFVCHVFFLFDDAKV